MNMRMDTTSFGSTLSLICVAGRKEDTIDKQDEMEYEGRVGSILFRLGANAKCLFSSGETALHQFDS